MKQRSEDGFTLIEVMISILLTAIAIIGIMALYMTETKASSYSRHATEATVLAADKLEKLRTMAAPACVAESGLTPLGASGGLFDRDCIVTPNTSPEPDWIDLQVTVSWSEDGTPKRVDMYGRRGL